MKNIILLSVILLTLASCSSNTERILIDSSGRMNHILMVIDNDEWQGKVGNQLRKSLAKEALGLPQSEAIFHLNQISKKGFTSFLRSNRNIIFVKYAKENSFVIKNNVYAKPQKIIHISAKNKNNLLQLIKDNEQKIISEIKKGDLAIWQRKNLKNSNTYKKLKAFESLGFKMKIPHKYEIVQDSINYLWLVKDIPEGYLNLLMYSVPITSEEVENGENIIADRDKRGYYVPGSDGTHMITEPAYSPYKFDVNLDGKKAYETKGKWMMIDDFMAGPFLNYSIVDKINNRLLVVEGFTYAPNINKMNYMFELEAILKTVKLN